MSSRHAQAVRAVEHAPADGVEIVASLPFGMDVHSLPTGVRRHAVGHDATATVLRDLAGSGVVGGNDCIAIRWNEAYETTESIPDGIQRAIVVQVVGLDVGDDGRPRREAKE